MIQEHIHPHTQRMAKIVMEVAEDICEKISTFSSDTFIRDEWDRKDHKGDFGGGGITRIARQGSLLESGAVNTSIICGDIDPKFATQLKGESTKLEATGVSLIFHPINPHVPTIHMNFRYIRQGDKEWFGGGADLTPYIPDPDNFRFFHNFWKDKLNPYGSELYTEMKKKMR